MDSIGLKEAHQENGRKSSTNSEKSCLWAGLSSLQIPGRSLQKRPLWTSRPLVRPPPFPTAEDANSRPAESRPELEEEAGKGSPSPDRSHRSQQEQAQWSEIMGENALEPGSEPGAPAGGPVHAVTVVTLLEKLATMLEALRERQGGLAERQGGLAGSVRRIQSGLGALSRSHDTTSNTLAQLLAKAERVGSHADAAQERAVRRAAQVQRLEANHGLLVARGKLHVLLFKVSDLRHPTQPPPLGYHRGGTPAIHWSTISTFLTLRAALRCGRVSEPHPLSTSRPYPSHSQPGQSTPSTL